jgi:glycine/D-amino acid oxidase-like deaminating enzyme
MDGRIVWGGYDANYYFGNDTSIARETRTKSHELLARHFFDTFPQLSGTRFEYQWAGVIDSTSRFTPYFTTARNGRVASALGFTGLGTGSSRFGAQVALDLLYRPSSALLDLELVRKKPLPFPSEPLRFPLVQFTRKSLVREDQTGRRNAWLKVMDALKVGFNS